MKIRHLLQVLLVAGSVTIASSVFADAQTASSFIEGKQQKITQLLKSNANSGTVATELDRVLDYDELVRLCFKEHWTNGDLTEAQKVEIGEKLKKLVQKNYRKNLMKTLKYTITYKGESAADGGTWKVKTSAQSDVAREPPVLVQYIVKKGGDGFQIIDIITENSSLTLNYYKQFHKYLAPGGEGYNGLKKKIDEKLAKN